MKSSSDSDKVACMTAAFANDATGLEKKAAAAPLARDGTLSSDKNTNQPHKNSREFHWNCCVNPEVFVDHPCGSDVPTGTYSRVLLPAIKMCSHLDANFSIRQSTR